MKWQAHLECEDIPRDLPMFMSFMSKYLECSGHVDPITHEVERHIAEVKQVRTEGTQRYIDSGEYEGEYGKD